MVCLCLLRGQDDDLSLVNGVGVHKTVGVALEDGLVLHQIGICKGGFTMKKIGLGIAILLFAIIISLCSSGMGLLVIGIGIVGLIFSIVGFMERK